MTHEMKYIVQSNWKMYKNHQEALGWVRKLGSGSSSLSDAIELIVCVPFIHLRAVAEAAREYPAISVGAQNVHEEEMGAYTGEISAPMITDAGGQYCVVGHSERRTTFNEDDSLVSRKTQVLLKHGIHPIVCIGESIDQRNRGLTFNQIERQVITCFAGLSHTEMQNTVVLYEPIWSIGTGNNATPDQVQEAHRYVRKMLSRVFSPDTANATRIMYGGSVKVGNVKEMVECQDVDGVGVGSGSLNVQDFLEIARICSQSRRVRQME
ncbi:MAG: triose-phosphate isomerase [Deltaproteobacteria bacterium]|nr:triose-phosphate isomerase [Deltaproteobacteria bacterium]